MESSNITNVSMQTPRFYWLSGIFSLILLIVFIVVYWLGNIDLKLLIIPFLSILVTGIIAILALNTQMITQKDIRRKNLLDIFKDIDKSKNVLIRYFSKMEHEIKEFNTYYNQIKNSNGYDLLPYNEIKQAKLNLQNNHFPAKTFDFLDLNIKLLQFDKGITFKEDYLNLKSVHDGLIWQCMAPSFDDKTIQKTIDVYFFYSKKLMTTLEISTKAWVSNSSMAMAEPAHENEGSQ